MHATLGTAGHIDHGKSTLVAALTGQPMDRLPEEKRRGITLELGFAHLDLGGGVLASVVDVPGHEKLVHTMVAGAWGLDVLLLVVAADEGVMPQTREHLAIAHLLGIRGTVVALTKVDRVDADMLALATEDIRQHLVAHGLADAPVVPVSAATGEGLPQLRQALLSAVNALPARAADGVAFLPVDRVFSVRGFGTVVTGTLSGGTLRVEDTVDLHPGPTGVRVRGLQRHGVAVQEAPPGWRVAVNLTGVEVSHLERGAVLCPSGALRPSRRLEVLLQTLPEAPRLRDFASVMVHVGAAAVPARVRCVFATAEESPAVEPGVPTLVQLILERPLACRPGQRFILRGHRRLPGQGATFGGGEVLDPVGPVRRRGRQATLDARASLLSKDPAARLLGAVRDAGAAGISLDALEQRLPRGGLRARLEDAVGRGKLRRIRGTGGEFFFHPSAVEALVARVQAALTQHHSKHPLDAAVPLESLRSALPVDGAALDRHRFAGLLHLARPSWLVVEGDTARLSSHRPRGVAPQVLAQLLDLHTRAGVAPPTRAELLAALPITDEQLGDALRTLVSQGALVRIHADLHFPSAVVADLTARTLAFVDAHNGITTQQFKDLMGQSRKFVIPFLEYLDGQKVTLRVGEKRIRRAR